MSSSGGASSCADRKRAALALSIPRGAGTVPGVLLPWGPPPAIRGRSPGAEFCLLSIDSGWNRAVLVSVRANKDSFSEDRAI